MSANPTTTQGALIEYAKNVTTGTFENIKGFISTMIPLTTGLITIYFALLEFLGIKETGQGAAATIGTWEILYPEWLFIASLLAFIAASFPVVRTIVPGNLLNVRRHRNDTLRWKYGCILVGCSLFILGLVKMILIAIQIIGI